MLQMVMRSGDNEEEILDLVDVPEFVLVQFCEMILKHHDLRNPDSWNMLQETVNALKIKAENEPVGPYSSERSILKAELAQIDQLLQQFNQENHNPTT